MHWIAPTEKDAASASLEKRLWDAAGLAICGVEKTDKTGRLCRLNLAVHGLEGDIRHGGNVNSYYDDPHNANYLWIQLFYSALNATGRAGFVMANSASDACSSEQELRQKLIESQAVDVMVAVVPNMFYTVTLPCTLWFPDKSKPLPSLSPEFLSIWFSAPGIVSG